MKPTTPSFLLISLDAKNSLVGCRVVYHEEPLITDHLSIYFIEDVGWFGLRGHPDKSREGEIGPFKDAMDAIQALWQLVRPA